MEERVDKIEQHLVEIKQDLKYHIKRTDELQTMVEPTYKLYVFGSYLIKSLVPVSIIVGIMWKSGFFK